VLLLWTAPWLVGRATAQVAPAGPPVPGDTVPHDTVVTPTGGRGVSPRGAFLRAIAVPGWGHVAIGSYRRAGFYFAAESVTAWGLIRTHEGIHEADARERFRETTVRADLAAQGVTDPAMVQKALDGDDALTDLIALQNARRSQREDWTALGIFIVFLSGADAYVSAHLQHFPTPITLNAQPVGGGRMEISVGVKLPR
jgi:Family of unknown function (DUF5683)